MKSASKSSNRGLEKPAGQTPNDPSQVEGPGRWTARTPGRLVLLAGWVLPQVLLLGPALVGLTVNLPVDLLVDDPLAGPSVLDVPAWAERAANAPLTGILAALGRRAG